MPIDTFTGPIAAAEISEWLSNCEEDFDQYKDRNSKDLLDKQKIQRAGNSISKTGASTKPLASWYTQNRKALETKTWDTFRDSVKDHALGKGWRLRALKQFYLYAQGDTKLDDFFVKFEELKYTIARSSKLTEIDNVAYKSHLLFRANPGLLEKFMRDPKNEQIFLNSDPEDVKSTLREYDNGDPVPAPIEPTSQAVDSFQTAVTTGMWLTSGLFGANQPLKTQGNDNMFSSMSRLPLLSTSLAHLNYLNIWWNESSTRPQIQLLQPTFDSNPQFSINSPINNRDAIARIGISLDSNEYIVSVRLTRDDSNSAITSILIQTSKQNQLHVGSTVGDVTTFTAPTNWRIVGFHGSADSYKADASSGQNHYPITRLGVIYAPIMP